MMGGPGCHGPGQGIEFEYLRHRRIHLSMRSASMNKSQDLRSGREAQNAAADLMQLSRMICMSFEGSSPAFPSSRDSRGGEGASSTRVSTRMKPEPSIRTFTC